MPFQKSMFNKKRMFDNVLDWYITLWIIPEPPVEQESQKSVFLEPTLYIKGIEGYLIVSWHMIMINPSMWKFGSLVAIHCQSIGSSVILHWWSICTPLPFHWHSLGSQLVFHLWSIGAPKWQSNGSQLEIHWHTIDTPIVVQGYCIGTRVALYWQSNGTQLAIHW